MKSLIERLCRKKKEHDEFDGNDFQVIDYYLNKDNYIKTMY